MLTRHDVQELREIIEKARVILNTVAIPDGRAAHAKELLAQAVAMVDSLIARPTVADAMKSKKGKW